MDTSASNRRLRTLLTGITRKVLIPRPDFQRRLVWSNKDKVEFIRTVLDNYPFPEIYIAAGSLDPNTGEGSEVLVDGQQRITTLYQYFKGDPDLKLPKTIPAYSELGQEKQIEFLEYSVVVRDLGKMEIEDIKLVFQKINSTSYGLNTMEIDNARYDGEFKKAGEELANQQFFEKNLVFSSADIRRMQDVRYCLGLLTTVLSSYFNRDSEIETYLEKYNEEFPNRDKVIADLIGVLNFIDRLNFTSSDRAMKKADLFTLIIELYKLSNKGIAPDPAKVRGELDRLYRDVTSASESKPNVPEDANRYYRAALQASNDRGSRIIRGEIVRKILNGG